MRCREPCSCGGGSVEVIELEGEIAFGTADAVPAYEGPFSVTPGADPQTLATRGRRMGRDLEVEGIPVSVTENASSGYTVTIAS